MKKDVTVKEYIQSVTNTIPKDESADVILNITAKDIDPSSIQINLTRHVHPSLPLNHLLQLKGEPICIQNLLELKNNIPELKNYQVVTLVVKAHDYIQTKNQLRPEHQDLSINPRAVRTGSDPSPVSGSQRKLFSLDELSLIKKIEYSKLDELKESKSPPLSSLAYNKNYFIQSKKPAQVEFSTNLLEKIELLEDYFKTPSPTDGSSEDENDDLGRYMNACSSEPWRRPGSSY